MPAQSRDYDVVLFGATGYTGQIVAEYLHRNAGSTALRIALAGRSREKLEQLKAKLGADFALEVLDATDDAALSALAARAHVIATTVGPYAKYGMPLVTACANAGTHYCDLTGEVTFVRRSIDKLHSVAVKSGACIVHCAGFDSIPSDLGVWLAAETAYKSFKSYDLGSVRFILIGASGGFSGGTAASLMHQWQEVAADPQLRRLVADPYALSPERLKEPNTDGNDKLEADYDKRLGKWVAPFVMAPVNTRVVRRTNALLDYRYGRVFRYEEVSATAAGLAGRIAANAIAAGMRTFYTLGTVSSARAVIGGVLPKPGDGPSKAARERGYFHIEIAASTPEGEQIVVTVRGTQDPGYGETAKMLSETALALRERPAGEPGGVLTPAAALGGALITRLRAAGMTFEAQVG
jgi:short subunit dehydrogenase-like uncharacterized protein